MSSLAMLSLHGCPVARLGEKDTGGMNVYVLQLAREFARRGHEVDVFTKHHDPNDPKVVDLEEGARVIHLEAGPYDADKYDLFNYIPTFLDQLYDFQREERTRYDLIHSHYWLSGRAGMSLSRRWDVPHTTTFHTLAKTKLRARAGEREPQIRQDIEAEVMSDSDGIVVSTEEEKQDIVRMYDASSGKVEIIPAGVNLDTFSPQDKAQARRELGISESNVLLYVGRIEPLKGIDTMLRAAQLLECGGDLRVLIVGGSPGSDSELERLKTLAGELGHRRLSNLQRLDPAASASNLLQRGGRVRAAVPYRELRPRRPRGDGVRHTGRGVESRWTEDIRGQWRDRIPGAAPLPGVVRPAHRRPVGELPAKGHDGPGGPSQGAWHGLVSRGRPDAGLLPLAHLRVLTLGAPAGD